VPQQSRESQLLIRLFSSLLFSLSFGFLWNGLRGMSDFEQDRTTVSALSGKRFFTLS
jgi:hypothetical protein